MLMHAIMMNKTNYVIVVVIEMILCLNPL